MKVAVLVLLGVVLVVAQHPRHCVAPLEFEAHAFQIDPKMQMFRRGHFAYDARMERTSFFEEVLNGTDDEYFHTIHLYRERRVFDYNLKTKVCTARDLPHRFHRIEIPHAAHFVGDAIVGTNAFENAGVLTTHWEHHNDTEHWRWFGVFTDRSIGCVPVMDHYHDQTIGTVQSEFFDVVLGISDPNVFIPDQSCPHNQPTPAPVNKTPEDCPIGNHLCCWYCNPQNPQWCEKTCFEQQSCPATFQDGGFFGTLKQSKCNGPSFCYNTPGCN